MSEDERAIRDLIDNGMQPPRPDGRVPIAP